MSEASSTLPRGEEEPQRASYAAAEGVVTLGIGWSQGSTAHARDRGLTNSARGGGRLLSTCGQGRTDTTWRFNRSRHEAVVTGCLCRTKGRRLGAMRSERAVLEGAWCRSSRSRGGVVVVEEGGEEEGAGADAVF